MKVAEFIVRADSRQNVRWKRAAHGEGYPSVVAWAAMALDAYLEVRAKSGLPMRLAWTKAPFEVTLGGKLYRLSGHSSYPFASFMGTVEKPDTYRGTKNFVLVFLPTSRVLATLGSFRAVKALASQLAQVWVRYEGEGEPPGKPVEEAVKALR